MERTITVNGVGKMSVKPDYVVITMTIEAKDKKYDEAMKMLSDKIDRMQASIKAAGFEQDSLKTTSFNVNTDYSYVSRKNVPERVFNGYNCTTEAKIEFDFEQETLSNAIAAITESLADAQFNIMFTVKDKDAVNDELLAKAAKNAKRSAEILCDASGAKLGRLVSINYSWNEAHIFTTVNYRMFDEYDAAPMRCTTNMADICPDDINLSDSAAFVWEIE